MLNLHKAVKNSSAVLNNVNKNINDVTIAVTETKNLLVPTLEKLPVCIDKIKDTVEEINNNITDTLISINELVDEGKKGIIDTRTNLNSTFKNVDILVTDIELIYNKFSEGTLGMLNSIEKVSTPIKTFLNVFSKPLDIFAKFKQSSKRAIEAFIIKLDSMK